ncbi:probable neutral amino acid permease [Sporisorium reilianum f. sp. reilianum]|uniref:Probable neutral amino acid permease n=1 Tax=Sporisorium reilianum f. sp. reilianum TaxID=72559 RepID=A0A2N8U5X4_9BASI|nr:probable neutral amino acid permease [Sporisorium reilianum f. sp. reilianum]
MASTGHATPTGDRSSGTLSPTHTVDVEKNGANDSIQPHDDAAKVSQPGPVSQTMFGEKREQYRSEEDYMYEQQKRSEGDHKFHRLGWKKLTICLLVEAIALGALSIPSAFATLGMVAGVIVCVGMGLIAIYTSYIVGQVKVKFPQVSHYADAGQLMMGRFGYELIGAMFAIQLTLLVGSHSLTGTIAFLNLSNNAICSLVFGVISAIILFIVAVPPSFSEVAILGYIDFASIVIAIGVVIIGTGIRKDQPSVTPSPTEWSAWPKEGTTFADAWIALTNIVFAYSFAVCQFSFMDEMHTPTDYVKSIWALGIIEIVIYTLTGALIYAFVGTDVKSPALLSAGTTLSKVAFGIALPVIFISGSINTTVVARYIHGRIFKNSVIRYINTTMGWITWLGLIALITVIAWVVAEIVPVFSDILGIMSALFISGFTFYFPALMWFLLIKEGKWNATRWNTILSVVNSAVFLLGMLILVCGAYASVKDIIDQYDKGTVRGAFTCAPIG